MLSYKQFAKSLKPIQLHPSEMHGWMSGLLAGFASNVDALKELMKHISTPVTLLEDVKALFSETDKQLKNFLFEFQLFIPDDKADLSERAEALTVWCQGFLSGLHEANIPLTYKEPSDIAEAIQDIIEISKVDYDTVIEDEEDEQAYMELVEFVRMAVIVVYQHLHTDSAKPVPKHLH